MSNDGFRGGDRRPDSGRSTDGGGPFSLSVSVVKRIADAADISPLELPPLNESIDPDGLDALFADADTSTIRAVSFRYANRRVRVTGNGDVKVASAAADAPTIAEEWSHVTPVGVARTDDLATRVVTALAEHGEHDPTCVRSELAEAVDLDAVAKLNRERVNGVPRTGATVAFSVLGYDVVIGSNGTISVGSTLTRLKRSGGNVLVVGAVPDDVVDAASATLLGDRTRDRRHLFALLDRDVHVVSNRLEDEDVSSARVIDYPATLRSTASDRPVDDPTPERRDRPTDIDELGRAIDDALEEMATAETDPEPGVVRLCVDSLRPIVDARETHETVAFLESRCESVRAVSGLGHYVLPIPRESPAVKPLESSFDATMELRTRTAAGEQRWHLHESDYTTDWFPLDPQ